MNDQAGPASAATTGPAWVDHAIWWHVYPLGFTGAPARAVPGAAPGTLSGPGCGAGSTTTPGEGSGEVRHRLRHLVEWLDYAIELGCSGLMLGPIFASESHGYDTVDYFRIDPRLGDDSDFDLLIAEAGRRGLRVVLDGVFNHVGRAFPRFVTALEEGSGTRLAQVPAPAPDSTPAPVPSPAPAPAPTPAPAHGAGKPRVPAARWFRQHTEPDGTVVYGTFEGHHGLVTLDHDEPAVTEHVIAVMDHWLDRGASGWRLDAAYAVPAGFWRRTLPAVRERHPDAWFVGEMIHGDYAGYVAESGLDSVTQYELWKAIWSALNDGNFFELAWALKRHNELLGRFTPLTFVGNHDVTRIASALYDPRHLELALAVLFTVGGVPSVYYGDEQAFQGVKEHREGGDDEIRPAFPDRPGDLAPYGKPVYRLHQRLIGLRRRNPWLVRARTTTEHLTNHAVALCSAEPGGDRHAQILTLLNIGDDPFRFPLEAEGLSVAEAAEPRGPHDDPLLVPPHGWAVLTRRG